jgi:alkylresorcinol/alkylpyrone synthase
MKRAAILSLTTKVPKNRHEQMEIHDRWLSPFINSHRARAIFTAAEIDTRYSVLSEAVFLADEPGTKARNDLYLQAARPLATRAINQALAQANLIPTDIDHFIVISCTGIDTPGLDVMLASDLGMRRDLRRSALIGMGCHAGLTGIDRALLDLTARPLHHVLILAIEFGTLHFQHGSKLDTMVADAIFGDGLAAAIIGPNSEASNRPQLLDTMTFSDYAYQDLMGFHLTDKGYQIHLASRVHKVLRAIVPDLVAEFLERSGLKLTDIRFWGIHPGGVKIIDSVGQALELEPEELHHSRQVLRLYGNMSSATIFFVLDYIFKQGQPRPGDYALLLAFGPGLTIELCLIQW